MSVAPAWLDSVTANGLPRGEIEATGTISDLGTLDVSHHIWLAAAGCARAMAAHGFEWQVGFVTINPRDIEDGCNVCVIF